MRNKLKARCFVLVNQIVNMPLICSCLSTYTNNTLATEQDRRLISRCCYGNKVVGRRAVDQVPKTHIEMQWHRTVT